MTISPARGRYLDQFLLSVVQVRYSRVGACINFTATLPCGGCALIADHSPPCRALFFRLLQVVAGNRDLTERY